MDKTLALAALSALGQSTRLDVFRLLVTAGPEGMAAGQIAESLGIRQNTMSTNLTVLLNAGLVTNERDGRSVRYMANMDRMRDLLGFLLEDCCRGQPELCQPILARLAFEC
ncbi:metalloregulator ArsR/SmtB family transcription factor [Pseudooceanicola sp. 216_PA32_1]|jgi:ArsR family transcriptional regulator, arsenate/arsenite/antimonite-responsive transcriptional repressor|uniref:Metalloregulator ArsR/SmtB family transcription factor n=1 Tax=Pseudooceanicola pacificus TaxID=2676438 RepID=A0A844W9L6_9RHOB|nr:metalloregulator ArsR/SmtB family transcription factor [Pseudooceanicola pacificus]MWB77238.1 metalloregulator ArsR/SmtB family transcription factor [Pseudooceanicola pacificus]